MYIVQNIQSKLDECTEKYNQYGVASTRVVMVKKVNIVLWTFSENNITLPRVLSTNFAKVVVGNVVSPREGVVCNCVPSKCQNVIRKFASFHANNLQ